MNRYVIDAGLAGKSGFLPLWWTLLGTALFMVCLRAGMSWLGGRIADESSALLRHTLLKVAQSSRGEQLQQFRSGVLLNRGMEDVRILCDGMINLLPSLLGNLTKLVGAFGVLMVLYPALAGVLVAAGIALGVGAVALRPVLRRSHSRVRRAEEEAFSEMQEYVQQLELIQALGAEEESQRRFRSLLDRSLALKRRRRQLSVGSGTAFSLFNQVGTGALLLWGIHGIAAGGLSYGSLTSMLQLVALFKNPVLSFSGTWGRLTAMEVSGERFRELLELEESQAEALEEEPAMAVVFEDVTFRYKPEEEPVLEHYSARFDLRSWTCLTGLSGRGKTTLFRLILGIYHPQEGRVYLETARGEIPCGAGSRRLFAYVPQDVSLFSGSILENLRLVAPEAEERACRQALETAQAHFVFEQAAGLERQVKEQRSGLSLGQIQRIAIARAVLMGRPCLLLDECTSALDRETERAVLQALRATGCGAILVTHRPEAVEEMEGIQSASMGEDI